jgi:hypothetical protein
MPPGRAKLCRKYGVITSPYVDIVRCMRCGDRWNPTRVLTRRGYRLPGSWYRCPNGCNTDAAIRFEALDKAPKDLPDSTGRPVDRPVDVALESPVARTAGTELLISAMEGSCSGEVLSLADLVSDVVAEPRGSHVSH